MGRTAVSETADSGSSPDASTMICLGSGDGGASPPAPTKGRDAVNGLLRERLLRLVPLYIVVVLVGLVLGSGGGAPTGQAEAREFQIRL